MFYSDLHCDTFYKCYVKGCDFTDSSLHVTLPELAKYSPCIQTFAHYIPEGTPDKFDFFRRMLENSLEIINSTDGLLLYRRPSDIERAEREGRVLAVLSVEGGDFFTENSAENLERVSFIEKNHIRFLSLCYNNGSNCCSGAHCKADGGLTALGRKAAFLLCERGVALDVSHLGRKSALNILETDLFALATHSNCLSICNDPRNLCDRGIELLVKKNSLMGINLYAPFISGKTGADVSDLRRHIAHIRSFGGDGILALGADLDGCTDLVQGVGGVGDIKTLDIPHELFYNNVKRFLSSK